MVDARGAGPVRDPHASRNRRRIGCIEAAHTYALGDLTGDRAASEAPGAHGRPLLRSEAARADAAAERLHARDLRDRRAAHARRQEPAAVAQIAVLGGGKRDAGAGARAAGSHAAATPPDHAAPEYDARQAPVAADRPDERARSADVVGEPDAALRRPQHPLQPRRTYARDEASGGALR